MRQPASTMTGLVMIVEDQPRPELSGLGRFPRPLVRYAVIAGNVQS